MNLNADHILALAPDAASAATARKLAASDAWQNLGRGAGALWGECRGSALYQVRVDPRDLAAKCSCPSRKFPCKHGLGLMLIAAETPDRMPEEETPPWVASWLASRAAAKESKATQAASAVPDAAQQAKRAEKRLALVARGIDTLDLWIQDLMRNGLAGLELQGRAFWEKQAARLVDSQAPALAARVRRLAVIPGSSPGWPRELLAELGTLALIVEAYRRLDSLDTVLQADVRALIGWSLKEDEVVAHGDHVVDRWQVLGQWVEEDERLNTQRTWLHGSRTGRPALILRFAVKGASFTSPLAPGTTFDAALAFWPSAYPLRALVHGQLTNLAPITGRLPGVPAVDEYLGGVSEALACQPWLERLPCMLRDVTPVPAPSGCWHVVDAAGQALPLRTGDHWLLLALSGGLPIRSCG